MVQVSSFPSSMPQLSSPLPATKFSRPRVSPGGSPDSKLLLRADSFGLGLFVSASDLSPDSSDLVQIDRVLYSEWCLYVGNGNVAHVSGSDPDSDIPSDSAVVRVSPLSEVAGQSGVRVNNKAVGAKERGLEALPAEEVLEKCLGCADREVPFNMLTKNSEHYVTEWKYGKGWSDQAAVTMSVMRSLSQDCDIGHNILVSGLNAVLNSPGSPVIGRSSPRFSSSPDNESKN